MSNRISDDKLAAFVIGKQTKSRFQREKEEREAKKKKAEADAASIYEARRQRARGGGGGGALVPLTNLDCRRSCQDWQSRVVTGVQLAALTKHTV